MNEMTAGDFTGLADQYSLHRPDYSSSVMRTLLALVDVPVEDIDFADIGAGTGIWTRMVCQAGVKSIVAVEPNDDMRRSGIVDSEGHPIQWRKGTAEETQLPNGSFDLVTMASSFHWADFDSALEEFHRILRPRGRFVALWNPRLIETNPLLVEIESYLSTLKPTIRRISSGRSGVTANLSERLSESRHFGDVIYVEGRHEISMSPERYLGIWRSVNDLAVQLGRERFEDFLSFVEGRVTGLESIQATYLTRAWSARRED